MLLIKNFSKRSFCTKIRGFLNLEKLKAKVSDNY